MEFLRTEYSFRDILLFLKLLEYILRTAYPQEQLLFDHQNCNLIQQKVVYLF